MRTDRYLLPALAPGTERSLTVHRFGTPGARPLVWLQAALHADELPGTLLLHHLMPQLAAAEAAGELRGEIRVAPFANPIGLAQFVGSTHSGRFALEGSGNFNRGFAELRAPLLDAVRARLTPDAAHNVAVVREALAALLDARPAHDETHALKHRLQRLACDADIALDLHCDSQAELHIYCGPRQADAFARLGARLGAAAVLTAEDSGDVPFDESLARPWWHLMAACPDRPLPADACLACTVELRGTADLDHAVAAADAAGLFAWLQDRGVIAGPPPAPPPPRCTPTPLDAVETIKTLRAGLWVPRLPIGTAVTPGTHVGDIVDPTAPAERARQPLHCRAEGRLFARVTPGLVRAGDTVAKVAGREPLPDRVGLLLEP